SFVVRRRSSALEEHRRQRRQGQRYRIWPSMSWNLLRWPSATIPHVAARVIRRVAVQEFVPVAIERNSHAIINARHRSEITYNQNHVFFAFAFSKQGNNTCRRVIAINPLEPCRICVEFVQRGLFAENSVQLLNPLLYPRMHWILQHMPLQAHVMSPLAHLAKFIAHEQQLLPGLRKHVAVQQTQIRELLPFVSRHLADQRTLAMDYFIVRERQHKIFGKSVDHTECQQIMMKTSMNRIIREIRKRIVHPSHVPLHSEP